MPMKEEDPDLEDALDGLIAATHYAEEIGEDELAKEISSLYQDLGRVAPDDHWDEPGDRTIFFGF